VNKLYQKLEFPFNIITHNKNVLLYYIMTSNNMAKLNSIHYLVDKHPKNKAKEKIIKKLEDTDYELNSVKRGVASFKNKKDGSIVTTIKGTNPKNKSDLISDIKLGLGLSKYDSQFKHRQKQVKNIYKDNPDVDKHLSGHSLGASIVTGIMSKSKSIRDNTKSAETFNTGYTKAFHKELIKDLKKEDKKEINNKLTHHHVKGDIISDALTDQHLRKLKKYNNDSINPLKLHGLESIIDDKKTV